MESTWQNITDPIFHYATVRPDAPALIQDRESLSYRELAALVGKATVYLKDLGIAAGDRVAVAMTNGLDHFVLSLGLLRIGATLMEVPYNGQSAPVPAILAKFSVRMLFLEPGIAAPPGYRAITVDIGWHRSLAPLSGDHRYAGSGDDIYHIALTSGTTGTPKGSLTSHNQYFLRATASAELLAETGVFSPDSPANYLLTASIGYATFFRRFISQLFIGGPVIILPEYLYVLDLIKAIAVWDNALCFVTSAMCRVLVACAPAQGLLFPRLRALIAGGGQLYAEDKLAVLDKVSPHFYESYGTSGFGTVSVLSPAAMRRKSESSGKPPSFVTIEAADKDGQALPAGTLGRIRCRGSESKGFAAEESLENDERFRDGWYYPGDIGYVDADGYIFLKGRTVDLIQRPEGDIFSSDIEAVIAAHPSVQEVAVIGLPRRNGAVGEDIYVVAVRRGDTDNHAALAEHCRTKLPRERWPTEVFYASALPKNQAGKLDRMQVKAMAAAELQRRG